MTTPSKSYKQDVYMGYERWSETYDVQTNPTRDLSARVVQELVPDLEGLVVVEVQLNGASQLVWAGLQATEKGVRADVDAQAADTICQRGEGMIARLYDHGAPSAAI